MLFRSINISLLRFPLNGIILLFLILTIIIGHYYFRNNSIVKWLSSTKAAISSIVGFSVISLLMGFISQGTTTNSFVSHLGLNNISFGWAYIFALLFLVLALGFATVKRIYPLKKQNFWYILNHLGLWITLVAANFGFADQVHLRMNVSDADYSNFAFDESGMIHELPFRVKQTNFKLENYNPKLTVIDKKTSMYSLKTGKNTIEVKENARLTIENWSISILKNYNSARNLRNNILPFDSVGCAPAALVSVENLITKEKKQGWISSGNPLIDRTSIELDNLHTLVMLPPMTKEMSLTLNVKSANKSSVKTIAVNSPQKVDGWKMYIFSFNEQKGKWSNTSVIELIKDPWQPFVFLGLGMMIIGSFFVFWRGKK